MKKSGIGSHQSGKMETDEWLTPPHIINALGEFELDPCAAVGQPWRTAKMQYTKIEDGLMQKWSGCVWMNPPYSRMTDQWLSKLKAHGDGIGLTFARTETRMFFKHVWNDAHAVLFIQGRLHFYYINGTPAKANSGGPSCLIAYGKNNVDKLGNSGINGKLVVLK